MNDGNDNTPGDESAPASDGMRQDADMAQGSPADLLDRTPTPDMVEEDAETGDEFEDELADVQPFDAGSADAATLDTESAETDAGQSGEEMPGENVAEDNVEADTLPAQAETEEAEPDEELEPLPVNAVVGGKYVIQHQLHHSSDRNLYRVTARRQQACAICGRLSSEEAQECEFCGSPATGQSPAEFYLMAEGFYPEALIQDPNLMALNLYHPSLVPVIDFFSYKPFERTRYFAIAEPRQGARLSQMSMPRPATQVLNWAMQLADALDYLHNRGVVGAGAEADDILVQDDKASLASLQNARASAASEAERIEQQSMDLARLAGTIYEAYTGNPPSVSPEGMLPSPAGAPEQVGAAFRAAIEPVQGAARPISAMQWRNLLASSLEAMAELERPGRPVSFVSASMTNVGRLREQNQDSYGVAEFIQESEERPFHVGLYVVADGMGGHKGGEFASALSVQAFSGEIIGRVISPLVSVTGERPAPNNEAILQAMTTSVQTTNDRVYKSRSNRQNDMGTTLVAAVIAGGKAYIVNVGDSRLYLLSKEQEEARPSSLDATQPLLMGTSPLESEAYLRGARLAQQGVDTHSDLEEPKVDRSSGYTLTQVSVDHSLVHRLVELGQLDPEEAKTHPHRNFIYRSLGGPPPVEIDTFIRTLHPGDRLLLCSDGLNSMIEDEEIEAVLVSEDDPQTACRRLIDLANEAGGHDNITTIIIDVVDYLPYSEPL
ncbi:MAG TPA: protein phosphatase 2C domain-containing protein [Chloroflexia bacterium]|nr:protein phosphatase 2C domain-containing protein [Chloroflexia bacterium]